MSKRTGQHNNKGFTLLEVMIAMTVFAILAAMAYGGLSNLLNQNKRIQKAQDAMQELQFAMVLLQQDINQIIDRPIRDEYGEQQKALVATEGAEKALEFTRGGWPNPAGQNRSSLLRTAWGVEDEQLTRYYWKELDRSTTSEAVKISVLPEVEGLSIRFLDEKNNWSSQWPTDAFLQPDEIPKSLPVAIEVTLDTRRWGEIKRLFPLIESPTMTADEINPENQNNNS